MKKKNKQGITILTLRKENITDFSLERNRLLKNIPQKSWALFLDSDEKLVGKISIDSISGSRFDSYKLLRRNYFLNCFVGEEYLIRLVKKDTGIWVRAVHEVWETKAKVGVLRNCYILHHTAKSLDTYLEKINKYSDIHSKQNMKESKKSSLFKVCFYPLGKFVVTLIGSKNVVFSIMQSLHSFLSWTKLYFLQH